MTKIIKLIDKLGSGDYNIFLSIAERTPINGFKLLSLTKKDLLSTMGQLINRYDELMDMNTKLKNEIELLKDHQPIVGSLDVDPEPVKPFKSVTNDTSSSIKLNTRGYGVHEYPQWN